MKSFLRSWKKFDLEEVQKSLIVAGELSSECFSCHKIGLKLEAKVCDNCGVHFKYMGFRRKVTPSFLNKVKEQWPEVIMIDFDDFKKALGKKSVRDILNL